MAKKITKNINYQYNPIYFDPYNYGFGSWLGKNAGIIGTVAGGIGGAFLGNPMLGAKIGGGVGGAIQGGQEQQTEQTEMLRQQQLEALKKDRIANLPSTFNYQPTFAKGGKIPKSEIIKGTKEEMEHTSSKRVSRKTAMDHLKEDPKYYTKLKKAGLADSYYKGGLLTNYTPNSFLNTGLVNRDNTTEFKNGGTHENNPLGGIPIGQNALVEEEEVRFDIDGGDSYIFSNRIPYKKKNNG